MVPRILGLLATILLLAGCGGQQPASAPRPEADDTVEVTSAAFTDGGAIPSAYTCRGAGTSPPLQWTGTAAGARAWALVVDDPDAPGGSYVHWAVVDIPLATPGTTAGRSPAGGVQLPASGGPGWSPPCPPSGTHHYRFSVYALRAPLHLSGNASLEDAMQAIGEATLAWGRLTGTVAAD